MNCFKIYFRDIIKDQLEKMIAEKCQQSSLSTSSASAAVDTFSLPTDYSNMSSNDIMKLVSEMTSTDGDDFTDNGN